MTDVRDAILARFPHLTCWKSNVGAYFFGFKVAEPNPVYPGIVNTVNLFSIQHDDDRYHFRVCCDLVETESFDKNSSTDQVIGRIKHYFPVLY